MKKLSKKAKLHQIRTNRYHSKKVRKANNWQIKHEKEVLNETDNNVG